ncbi:MAG: glycosyltransferase family 2 protein [Chthoniobacterales bacterium]
MISKKQPFVCAPPVSPSAKIGIVIPACNEEACIGAVLTELLRSLDAEKFVVLVGVNGSTDRTAEIARSFPVVVAETPRRGYGFGCEHVIDVAARVAPPLGAYIFFAGDGASDPRDIPKLVAAYEQGYQLVLGARTATLGNWPAMTVSHVFANRALALWCAVLTRRWFTDLAPLRLIERELFERLALREMTYGWTIEAQIGAATFGAEICEVPGHERPRRAGEQKVSGVNWRRTFMIGCRIVAAGWRARVRFHGQKQVVLATAATASAFVAQAQRSV